MNEKKFQSELLGTQECVVDPSRCDRDSRILSGCAGYGPQIVYGALATRTIAYLPGRLRVLHGVRAINNQYALHVAPQHHPMWAGLLDGVGYGMFVVEIKDNFLVQCRMDVVDLSCMEQLKKIGKNFCRELKAKRILMPPNVVNTGGSFLFSARIQSPVVLSSLRLLRKCLNGFCSCLEATAFMPPPNVEEADSFLDSAKIASPVDLSSMRLLRKAHGFCSNLNAPAFLPPPNIEVAISFLSDAKIRSVVDLSSMRLLRYSRGGFCSYLKALAFIPPPNVEEVESFLHSAKIASSVDLSSMRLLKKCRNFCSSLMARGFITPPNIVEVESFLHDATIRSPVDLSSMRLLRNRGCKFCAGLVAPSIIQPPNVEEATPNLP